MGLDEHLATKQDIEGLRSMISGLVTEADIAPQRSQPESRIGSGIWLPAIAQSLATALLIVAVVKLLGLD